MGTIELRHAQGYQKPNHKYVSRKWENGHWHYYYTNSKTKGLQRQVADLRKSVDENAYKSKVYGAKAAGNQYNLSKQSNKKMSRPEAFNERFPQQVRGAANTAASKAYKSKSEYDSKQLKLAEAQLYTSARNDARAVMANSKYKKRIERGARKAKRNRERYLRIKAGKAKVNSIIQKLKKSKAGLAASSAYNKVKSAYTRRSKKS